MDDQISQVVAETLVAAIEAPLVPLVPLTRRDVRRPQLPGKALAVIGTRRAGKTTYVHQVRQELMAAGRSGHRLVDFNFEDERLAELRAKDLGVVIDTWRRLFPEPSPEPLTFFLDEIQHARSIPSTPRCRRSSSAAARRTWGTSSSARCFTSCSAVGSTSRT